MCRACTCTRSPRVLTYILHTILFDEPATAREVLKSSRPHITTFVDPAPAREVLESSRTSSEDLFCRTCTLYFEPVPCTSLHQFVFAFTMRAPHAWHMFYKAHYTTWNWFVKTWVPRICWIRTSLLFQMVTEEELWIRLMFTISSAWLENWMSTF